MQSDPDFSAPANLDDVLGEAGSRRAWRGRWLAAGATLLVGALLAAQLAGLRLFPQQVPAGATYTLTLASNVTWTIFTLTLNDDIRVVGNRAAAQIILHQQAEPYDLWLTAAAPPFMSQTCRIVIPFTRANTCMLVRAGQQWRVLFPFALRDLPPQEQASVAALVADSLAATQPTTGIPAGGHYVVGDVLTSSLIAPVALIASLRTTRAPTDLIPDPTCPDLCAPADMAQWSPSALDLWHVRTFVRQDWYFARSADGRAVGTTHENLIPHAIQFDLNYDAAQDTWLTAPPDQATAIAAAIIPPLCADGHLFVESLYFVPASALAPYHPVPTYTDHGLNGCLLRLVPTQTSTSTAAVTFLWRTGQLYAVGTVAHAAEPTLPAASALDLAAFASS